jgi:signal transduction histidine kinase
MNQDVQERAVYTILLLEDGPEDKEMYKRLLRKNSHADFVITEVGTVAEAKTLVTEVGFDCYVVDYHLPDAHGVEFIKFLTHDPEILRNSAIVMVTGQGSEEIAVEALKLGADDYITKKNISDGIFVRPLLNAIERAQLTAKILHYQNELERSNKELSDFTHTASHDLKAPLRRIASYCDILKEDAADRLNDEDRAILGRMIVNAGRMQQLIDGLLTYSLIQYEKEEREYIDLNEMVAEIIDEFEPQILECHAKIEIEALPEFDAYPLRMRQLFTNLISNALKYRCEKAPLIHISSIASEGMVTFRVRDNGQGIPQQYHKDIFHDFKRLHSNEEIEGTGLGLPICRKIVQMHGGKIWVESEPGAGSTFVFTIRS